MTNSEALNFLLNIAVQGEKSYHKGYARTVQYARDCKAYFGGVGIDDYLKPFTRRESPELFKQRKEITAHIQSSLGNMLQKPFAKVERSNWTKIVTLPDDKDGDKAKQFERETLSKFSSHGLFGYAFERLLYWNIYDPNTFAVVEFAPFNNERENAQPYPFEATAEMAVDFLYSNAQLEYLAVRQEQEKQDGDNLKKVERLTLYQPAQTVVLQQLTLSEIKSLPGGIPPVTKGFTADAANGDVVNVDNSKVYVAVIPQPHNLPKTPAVRTGYIDSPDDDGATKLGIFDAALPWAKKILKSNSEMDLMNALLAFPVSIRHAESCDATGCAGGKLHDGTTCVACHGSGKKQRPTSVQEEIVLDLPDRADEMLDVNKIMTYVYVPVEAVKLVIDTVEKWMDKAMKSVFNSQMYARAEVAQTAMYHGVELQSIYDTLYPYGRHISQVTAYLADCIGYFTGKGGAVAMPVIPSDLRFETVGDLFAELKSLRDAGGGNDAAALIQTRIMERLLRDDPEGLLRWRIDDQFNPFRGMTEEQILEAMNSGLVPEPKKVFYVNRADIMAEILSEKPNFYRLARQEQKRLIDEKVVALMSAINAAQPTLNIGSFGRNAVNLGDRTQQPDENATNS